MTSYRLLLPGRPISLQLIGVFLVLFMVTQNLSFRVSRYADDEEFFKSLLHKRPRSYQPPCVGGGSKCFSSGQCCAGLVCATLDDYFGKNPEVPGFCVKEKDLTLCTTDEECQAFNAKCLALGRTGEQYCVGSYLYEGLQPEPLEQKWRHQAAAYYTKSHGGLGSPCQTSIDCNTVTPSDGAALCCQDISRARQGIKRMCSRVIAISQCI